MICILLGKYPGSIKKSIKMPVGGFLTITTLGLDILVAELLKIDGDDEPVVRERLRAIFVEVWNGREMPQE